RETSLAEDRDRLLHVAVRLRERCLAFHHAGACLLAKLLDLICRNRCRCHSWFSVAGRLKPAPTIHLVSAFARCTQKRRPYCGRRERRSAAFTPPRRSASVRAGADALPCASAQRRRPGPLLRRAPTLLRP